jgi:hypothetical protein
MNRFFQSEDGALFPLEQVKTNLLSLVNADLKASLFKTDWQVIRASDPTSNKPLAESVRIERQAARDLAISLETKINNAKTHDVLKIIYNEYL